MAIMTHIQQIKQYLPWAQTPLIINAPMSGAATSKLAVAVTRAGGLGHIGFLDDKKMLNTELEKAKWQLSDMAVSNGTLPIGVGVIVFGSPVSQWLSLFAAYKPAVVWLSFGTSREFQGWTEGIRGVSPDTKIWIQVGSVAAALDTARVCQPDALVLQGNDAGGHGHASGASIISLLPEVSDVLCKHRMSRIPLIAAGGIVEGRGVAAAIMLGAAGVVMGTRFLAAEETNLPPEYREAIINAVDGGVSTVRSRVFDETWGPSPWPVLYDGRCLRNASYDDVAAGIPMQEVVRRFHLRLRKGQEELDIKDSGSVWAGTGVGLVKKVEDAASIVNQVRLEAARRLENGTSLDVHV
ncbi:hypothetical protein CNMCM6936_004678 [Aspergillus lentulus]|uniref:Nitronate monooxygenase n=1 Tax=Aspergillus lentulus TaxID=293939 RepID=A0AAN6BJF8_ASPLE|nr:hypothetical protein CNMCM6936_004678 [Aspergillus lentulus]KAF4170538.1 hypothetical protein CNMCM8060_004918 [Aspergillus lentulus]KAF4188502.1 hypothetical protein CNMCM8694_004678 [Aspergillus lentulus]KAF4199874.1 hypothetical protein CNMCM8927_004530 [Aspergillus lentulus]